MIKKLIKSIESSSLTENEKNWQINSLILDFEKYAGERLTCQEMEKKGLKCLKNSNIDGFILPKRVPTNRKDRLKRRVYHAPTVSTIERYHYIKLIFGSKHVIADVISKTPLEQHPNKISITTNGKTMQRAKKGVITIIIIRNPKRENSWYDLYIFRPNSEDEKAITTEVDSRFEYIEFKKLLTLEQALSSWQTSLNNYLKGETNEK